jgi:hypothetical protein
MTETGKKIAGDTAHTLFNGVLQAAMQYGTKVAGI